MDAALRDDMSAVYQQLREAAATLLRLERPGTAPEPTSLVNEAVLRLLGAGFTHTDRRHLIRAVRARMRTILIDRGRRQGRVKHGGGRRQEPLDAVLEDLAARRIDPVSVYDALEVLAAEDGRAAMAVELHHLWGYTVAEVAARLDVSVGSVEKDLTYGRRRLRQLMSGGEVRP